MPLDHAVVASLLFVPATRPDRVQKALATSAGAVIVDLEDAVAPEDKDRARELLAALSPERPVHVRVNAVGSGHFERDVEVLAGLDFVDGVVLAKTESADQVAQVKARLPTAVVALVESARGVVTVEEIATEAARVAFGPIDYAADLGIDPSSPALDHARARIVVASAACAIGKPVDGPTTVLGDLELVRSDALRARELGFGAKLCIHPSQVDVVNAAFAPGEAELSWAEAVVAESERTSAAVFVLDGAMIDAPVIARARQLLARGAAPPVGPRAAPPGVPAGASRLTRHHSTTPSPNASKDRLEEPR